MGFTTLVDYNRQLTQSPNTGAEFSGDTTILGSLILGSVIDLPVTVNCPTTCYPYYSYLFMTGGTLTDSHQRYNPITHVWEVNMPDPTDATATEYVRNLYKIKLNDNGQNGQFGSFAQQSVFRYNSTGWDTIEDSGYHTPATVMVMGSGTTSATTAFTITSSITDQGIGKVGFVVDDALNVRIGERSLTAGTSTKSGVFLHGGVLTNQEAFDTVMIGSDGQVGTTASLRELKQNIDYEYDSSWIYDLKPVKFEFKKFPDNIRYGFIAEDVAEVNSHFAKYNNDGTLRGVKDEILPSVILKELVELRKKVDPSFRKTYEEDKVKIVSSDYEVIHDGTIIARGGKDIKLTISDSLSGVIRIKSLANVTVSSNRLIDEKWDNMQLESGSSVTLLGHENFIYILSSDGDKLK